MNNAFDDNSDMPIGLKMELTQNLKALNRFSGLSRMSQISFIEGARRISSKQEMQAYVANLMQD